MIDYYLIFNLNEKTLTLLLNVLNLIQTVQTPKNILKALVSKRFEPSSRNFLIGEQPNPWHLLQRQDKLSRHRGAEHCRRYGRLGSTSLLSPG